MRSHQSIWDANTKAYFKLLPELRKTSMDKWVLISRSKLIGIYDTYQEAIDHSKTIDHGSKYNRLIVQVPSTCEFFV